jgi:hypothetical protein
MRHRLLSVFAITALVSGVAMSAAQGHGSLSMEKDMCKLTLGRYQMHFAGYQPQRARAEFCEDIPAEGPTAIVLDFLQPQLRTIPIAVKIVQKLPDGQERTVVEKPGQVYPNGTITIRHDFQDTGQYVGLVSADAPGIPPAIFPFSVGVSRFPWLTTGLGTLLAILLMGMVWRWSAARLAQQASHPQG